MAATQQQPAQAPAVRRGWWRRNWKRLVLGVFLTVILVGGGAYYYLFGRMMLSEPFKLAWAEVRQSKKVQSELGEPIRGGWTPHGMIDWNSNIPEADMNFVISGPTGTADVSAKARRIDGVWGFARLEVGVREPDGSVRKRIDVAEEINLAKPPDVQKFDPTKQSSQTAPKIEEAPPDLNIKIDVDPPAGSK
jgi:Cytochrome oxidase complex assembly protein 1